MSGTRKVIPFTGPQWNRQVGRADTLVDIGKRITPKQLALADELLPELEAIGVQGAGSLYALVEGLFLLARASCPVGFEPDSDREGGNT